MRAYLALAALFGLLIAAGPRPATAGDPCGCGPVSRGFGGHGRCIGHGRLRGDHRCASPRWSRYAYDRGCRGIGSSWSGLRRYYDPIRYAPRHVHPRFYFLERWPCALGEDAPTFLDRSCPGDDFPWVECGIAKAALASETDNGESLDVDALSLEDRLTLGMERFYRGAFEEAARDFRAVRARDPQDPRPQMGLLMTALMQGETAEAAEDLHRLHQLGAVNGTDRLLLDACMDTPQRFLDVRDAKSRAARWHFHRVEPLVVAAWANTVTGETAAAQRQLRSALRFAPGHPVARHLLETLDGRAEPSRTPHPTSPADSDPDVLAEVSAD